MENKKQTKKKSNSFEFGMLSAINAIPSPLMPPFSFLLSSVNVPPSSQ